MKEKLKWCPKCKARKELTEFGKNRSTKDGLQRYCKVCRKSADRASYEKRKPQVLMAAKKRRQATMDWLVEFKKQKVCTNCHRPGRRDLDFYHHRDKLHSINTMAAQGYSIEAIRKEMKKCWILCRRCARDMKAKERELLKNPPKDKLVARFDSLEEFFGSL